MLTAGGLELLQCVLHTEPHLPIVVVQVAAVEVITGSVQDDLPVSTEHVGHTQM